KRLHRRLRSRRSSPGPRRNLLVWTWEALRQKCLPIGSFCREGPRAGVPIWYPVRVRIARSWSSRNVLRKVWDSIPSKLFCVSSFRRSRTHCGSQSLLCATMPQENGQWCTSSFRTISP
ncbi:unnamed protein product, partial [Fusarium equiseti]